MKTKFAIGCLVQWYECDIIGEYIESLREALDAYNGQVIVDMTIVGNQDLEQCISDKQMNECITKIELICKPIDCRINLIIKCYYKNLRFLIVNIESNFNINSLPYII